MLKNARKRRPTVCPCVENKKKKKKNSDGRNGPLREPCACAPEDARIVLHDLAIEIYGSFPKTARVTS
jgi:hypothetical protein